MKNKKPFAMYKHQNRDDDYIFYYMFHDKVVKKKADSLSAKGELEDLKDMDGEHSRNLNNGYNMVVAVSSYPSKDLLFE
jgi:hypothetical protein